MQNKIENISGKRRVNQLRAIYHHDDFNKDQFMVCRNPATYTNVSTSKILQVSMLTPSGPYPTFSFYSGYR